MAVLDDTTKEVCFYQFTSSHFMLSEKLQQLWVDNHDSKGWGANKQRGDSKFTCMIFSHNGQFLPLLPGQQKNKHGQGPCLTSSTKNIMNYK